MGERARKGAKMKFRLSTVLFGVLTFVAHAWPSDLLLASSHSCETPFEGFGVHLGAMHHFNLTNEHVVRQVVDKLYFELQLRHFRTSYEPYFSPSAGEYDIACTPDKIAKGECGWAWESLLATISEPRYASPERPLSVIASIWTPPYYMKDPTLIRLRPEYESAFHDYIRNVTALIQNRFGLQIEAVSPVNEPENVFAPWDHCNMDPSQLCRMVANFQDPLVSTCTENSYYWVTELYMGFKHPALGIDCARSCDVISTHAYALNLNPTSPNFLLAYYDLVPYERRGVMARAKGGPRIWQTEVSSTYHEAEKNQMTEGLDLATSIVNFVGTTCVERYYFWSAYTVGPSGESLMWGYKDEDSGGEWKIQFPKKYFIFNHFTNASVLAFTAARFALNSLEADNNGSIIVQRCTGDEFVGGGGPSTTCLKFDGQNTVFVNREIFHVDLNLKLVDCSIALCCTTTAFDSGCDPSDEKYILPPQSVCRCQGKAGGAEDPPTTPWATEDPTTHDPGSMSRSWKLETRSTFGLFLQISCITILGIQNLN